MTIPLSPDEQTRNQYVTNVINAFTTTTADQRARGKNWYPVAHQLAELISGGDVVAGAGVIAALSANKRWEQNTKLAARAFADGKPSGHFGDALRKVVRILAGERPEVVLPMASKTGNFYRCILDPTDRVAVCVDRHAHDIAVGTRYGNHDRGLSSKGRYGLLADVYREAGERLGVIPQEIQAITWVAHIERNRES